MKVEWFRVILALFSIVSVGIAGLSKQELIHLQAKQGNKVIRVDSENYSNLLSGKKDYHLVLLLTSDSPQINCVLCNEFKPEFELVGSSWIKDHPQGLTEQELQQESEIPVKDVFFLLAEFMESKPLFQALKLNNIPKVYYFPPTNNTGANKYLEEFTDYVFMQGSHSQLLANWLSSKTGLQFNIYMPPDYSKIGKIAATTFFSVIIIVKFFNYFVKFLSSKLFWCSLSIISVLLLTTGYMFNEIRGVPYVNDHGDGRVDYFLPGQQQQYGVETNILSFVYGFLSLLVILLVKKVPQIKNSSVNLLAIVILSSLIFGFYSVLLSIFGLKGMGYPYKFINIF
jgi:oligosaccharyltransferase complex subunit gamma